MSLPGAKRKLPPPISARRQGLHRFLRQMTGLSTKQWIILRRTPLALICQLCIPLIGIIVIASTAIGENVWSGIYAADSGEEDGGVTLIYPGLSCFEDVSCFSFLGDYDYDNLQPANENWVRYGLAGPQGETAGERDWFEDTPSVSGWLADNLPQWVWTPDPIRGRYLGYNETSFESIYECGAFCGPEDTYNGGFGNGTKYSPSIELLDYLTVEEAIADRSDVIDEAYVETFGGLYLPTYLVPGYVVFVDDFDSPGRKVDMTVLASPQNYPREEGDPYPGDIYRCYHFAPSDFGDPQAFLRTSECELVTAKQDLYTALAREWSGKANLTIIGGVASMPTSEVSDGNDFFFDPGYGQSLTFLILAPLMVSILFPIIMFEVITERQTGLRELMAMNGLAQRAYWISQFAWNCGFHWFIALVLWMVCWVVDLHCMRAGYTSLLWLLLLSGPPFVVFAYFCAQFFGSIRKATFFGFAWIIFFPSVVNPLNLYGLALTDQVPAIFMLFPHLAFQRVLHLYVATYFEGRTPYELGGPVPADFSRGIYFLIFDTILYMGLTIYADSVFKHGKGSGRHPLYPLFALGRALGLADDPETAAAAAALARANAAGQDKEVLLTEDPDVAAERIAIQSKTIPPNSPLIVEGLRKVYSSSGGAPPKVALDGMYLHMEPDEVLCLLGPNGSGKTTMMNVLVGVHVATGGNASVAGFDMATQMPQVRSKLGVVQQFDVLFDKLTALETCLFFCRVQGLTAFEELRVATSALTLVGLEGDMGTKAKSLSGGMKRRLSIAIAICGKPKLIFMDEPTTGLDPETRRALWDIIQELKSKSSIALTTHMMEEADALADRVAIMAKGSLRAIGTAQHLKNRFGQGYALQLNYISGARDAAAAFVQSVAPTAKVVGEYPGSLTFQIPPPVVVSSIFDAFENSRHMHGIRTWGINAASLEDVFLNLVTDDDLDGAESPEAPPETPTGS